MAKVYASSCEKGLKLFTQVPAKLQAEVRAIVEADGYEILDDGRVVKVEE